MHQNCAFMKGGNNMKLEERLDLYQNMILSCHKIFFWSYDSQMNLLSSNCPDSAVIFNLFNMGDTSQILQNYSTDHKAPIVMSNPMGMMWLAVPERDENELHRIHLLGPFFIDSFSQEDISSGLKQLHLSAELIQVSSSILRDLPVISLHRAFEYAMMLYYCIYEETISISDLHYQENQKSSKKREHTLANKDIHGTYEMEQQMVRMVREGNLDYKRHMDRMALTGNLGQLSQNGDRMRQMKNMVLVCAVLFSRAAIEGGLSPEIAMTLTDHYFQSVEASKSIPELADIAGTMQDDFVQRVHKCRNSRLSKPVQECCDYIDLHMDEQVTLKDMAEQLRYSEIYLCRKFKEETGQTFRDYVRSRKLERAKDMMTDNALSIRDISERLGFCSLSYFGKSFREAYGMSPSEWREQR